MGSQPQFTTAPAFYDERAARLFGFSPLTRMRRVCASLARPASEPVGDEVLVQRLQDAEAMVTQLQALAARDLTELRRRRVLGQSEAGLSGPAADEDGWVVSEVGVALALSDRQVHDRLAWARSLGRYRVVELAMTQGRVQSWTAHTLVDLLDELAEYVSTQRLGEVEGMMVRWLLAGPRTVTQLRARMRRLIVTARAEAGHDTDDDIAVRHARRRVSLTCERDGTATLFARLPEADGLALARALDQQARQPVSEHDERTLAQRQADLLVAAITGAPAVWGHPQDMPDHDVADPDGPDRARGVTTRLSVTIPVQTLLGGSTPAEVPGYGTIPAATARQLAGAEHTQARPLLYDATTGRLLGLGAYLPATRWWTEEAATITWAHRIPPAPGYSHPRLMEDFIRTRDQVCRAPGCRRPAAHCDCDHLQPWPTGPTSTTNTCCLCRRHHRLKTHAPDWHITGTGDTTLTWTTPTGTTAHTTPHDHRPHHEPQPDTHTDTDHPPF